MLEVYLGAIRMLFLSAYCDRQAVSGKTQPAKSNGKCAWKCLLYFHKRNTIKFSLPLEQPRLVSALKNFSTRPPLEIFLSNLWMSSQHATIFSTLSWTFREHMLGHSAAQWNLSKQIWTLRGTCPQLAKYYAAHILQHKAQQYISFIHNNEKLRNSTVKK